MAGAITSVEFTKYLEPFRTNNVAVAVSGGADSMALAFCLKRAGCDVQALIVEHGLRAESAQEAEDVAARLDSMGISATILPWQHSGVDSRIHVEARQARYQLMLDYCQKNNMKALFVAHHQDDQAETILMRFAKGSGVDGLAGMAAKTMQSGIQIARPFLRVPKERLVTTCEENDLKYVVDPSNEKDCYARGRLRRASELLKQEGFTPERLADLGERAAEAKDALTFYTNDLCKRAVAVLPSGALTLDLDVWSSAPTAVRLRTLSNCLLYLNPTSYSPERKQLLSFAAWIADKKGGAGRTLHGVSAAKKEGVSSLTFVREAAAISHELTKDGLWDDRWFVEGMADNEGLSIRALGIQEHAVIDKIAPDLRKKIPSGKQRAVLPALWDGDVLCAVPCFSTQNLNNISASIKTPFWAKSL